MSARARESSRRAEVARSAELFAALGDRTRLEIVSRLCAGGPASITHLTEGSGITRQAVTKHLQVLAAAGWARSSRQGRERIWEFDPAKLAEARRHLETIAEQWEDALGRLKAFVEKGSEEAPAPRPGRSST